MYMYYIGTLVCTCHVFCIGDYTVYGRQFRIGYDGLTFVVHVINHFNFLHAYRGGRRLSSTWWRMVATPTQTLAYRLNWSRLLTNTSNCSSYDSYHDGTLLSWIAMVLRQLHYYTMHNCCVHS